MFVLGGNQEQIQWLVSKYLTVGPKKQISCDKFSVYIFSIQVYITFLSIHVHVIIHIALLCILCCIPFIYKVLVNFGSQLHCLQFVKHSCNMSTLLGGCGLRGGGGWGPASLPGPRSLKSSMQIQLFPHIRSKVKVWEAEDEEATPAIAAAVGLMLVEIPPLRPGEPSFCYKSVLWGSEGNRKNKITAFCEEVNSSHSRI